MDTPSAIDTAHGTPDSTALSIDVDTMLNARIAAISQRIQELTLYMTQLEGDPTDDSWVETQNEIAKEQKKLEALMSAHTAIQETQRAHLELSKPSSISKPSPETTSSAKASEKVPRELPKFRSGAGSVHDPEDLLARFQSVLSAYHLDPEQHWHRLLPLCLTNVDTIWCESNLEPKFTWQKAKEAFIHQFGDPARIKKARQVLFKMRMLPGESVSEYAQRFEGQMRIASIPDSDRSMAAYFRETLPPDLHFHIETIIQMRPGPELTVKELIRIASSFGWEPSRSRPAARSAGSEHVVGNPRPTTGSRSFCQLHGECKHTTDECQELLKRKNQPKTASKTSAVASSSSPADPSVSLRKVTCHLCQQEGHYANVCPRKKTSATGGYPVVKLIEIMPAGNPAPPEPHVTDAIDMTPLLFPILLDGNVYIVQLDCAASRSLILRVNKLILEK
jgi:hypothetical protein